MTSELDQRKYGYAREKFRQAIYKLAVGEGDVRKRLGSAFRVIRILDQHDVPKDMFKDALRTSARRRGMVQSLAAHCHDNERSAPHQVSERRSASTAWGRAVHGAAGARHNHRFDIALQ
jgi:hypothetical protein